MDDNPSFGSRFGDFFASPFKGASMDAFDWFLLIGLIMVSAVLWANVLNHIKVVST